MTIDLGKAVPTLLGGLLLAGILGGIGLYARASAVDVHLAAIKDAINSLDSRVTALGGDVRGLDMGAHAHGPETRIYLPDADVED